MDTFSAFLMGEMNRHKELMVLTGTKPRDSSRRKSPKSQAPAFGTIGNTLATTSTPVASRTRTATPIWHLPGRSPNFPLTECSSSAIECSTKCRNGTHKRNGRTARWRFWRAQKMSNLDAARDNPFPPKDPDVWAYCPADCTPPAKGKARARSTRFLHCRFSAGCATSCRWPMKASRNGRHANEQQKSRHRGSARKAADKNIQIHYISSTDYFQYFCLRLYRLVVCIFGF